MQPGLDGEIAAHQCQPEVDYPPPTSHSAAEASPTTPM